MEIPLCSNFSNNFFDREDTYIVKPLRPNRNNQKVLSNLIYIKKFDRERERKKVNCIVA